MKKSAIIFLSAILACLLLLPSQPLPAQTAPDGSGELTGRVLAADGSGLPGAAVILTSAKTGAVVKAATGEGGIYRFPGLPAGAYDLRVEAPGFRPAVESGITIAAAGSRTVDFRLAFDTIQEVITVVGTAPRSSFESAEVRQSAARDVGEAVAVTPGIWKLRKGGIGNDVVVRGFRSQDMNILVDGQRIYGACPNHMDPAAFHADFAEVDRVEVGKGPFDVRHQGSLGGIVNVVTRKPEPGWRATVNASGGAYKFMNPAGTASYGSDKFSALGGFSYRASDPYEDGSGRSYTELTNYRPSEMDKNSFKIWTAWGRTSYQPAQGHLLQAAYTRQQADHVQYPYLMMDAIYDNTDRAQLGYRINRRVGPLDWLHAQAYFTRVDHWMTDEYRTSSISLIRDYSMGTHAKTDALGGTVEGGIGALTLGLEGFRRGWDAQAYMAPMAYKTQYSIPDVSTDTLGLYGLYGWEVNQKLRLDFAARVDTVRTAADEAKANTNLYFAYNGTRTTRDDDTLPSGSVRLKYKLSETVEFNAGAGHAARVADPVEKFYALQRKGTDWVGNPDLNPSRNTGIDAGIATHFRGLFVGGSVFYNWIADYIQVLDRPRINTVPGVMNKSARSYGNIDARLYGGEVEAAYALTPKIILSSDLSYVRGTQEPDPAANIESSNLAEIPPLRLRLRLRYDAGRYFAEAEGVFSAAQNSVNSDLLESPTPGYGIANLLVGVNLGAVSVQLIASNIFDNLYYENLSYQRDPFRSGVRVYEPGANLFINFTYRFGAR